MISCENHGCGCKWLVTALGSDPVCLQLKGGVNIANDQVISTKRDFSVCIGRVLSD